MTIRVLAEKGQNHCQIARTVGVSEGTVRYHLRRAAEGAVDGRTDRPFEAEPMAAVIAAWHAEREESPRPVNVVELYEHLVADYGYAGSCGRLLKRAGFWRFRSAPSRGLRSIVVAREGVVAGR